MDPEYLSLQAAADLIGVSRFKLWRLVKDGRLDTFASERDRREKLVKRSDVLALIAPRPTEPPQPTGEDESQ